MKDIGTGKSIRTLLANHNLRIKKHWGQNFLTDRNILTKIAMSGNIDKSTGVIEIGPGLGGLTEVLLDLAGHVLAYEIDADLIPILKANFADRANLTLIQQDILEVDIDEAVKSYLSEYSTIVVVANLPYYITTPILMKFLETTKTVNRMIFMMQEEVARRVTGKPATKEYGALSVVIAYRSETKYLFTVPRAVFLPEPNVDSAVVSVVFKPLSERLATDEPFFFRLIHQCFVQRRKTLSNNLLGADLGLDRPIIDAVLDQMGLPRDVRAERLSLQDFVLLAKLVKPTSKDPQ